MPEKPQKRSIFDIMGEYVEDVNALADQLAESAFTEGPSWNTKTCCLHALSNIFVTSTEVIITADLPNIEPETVKIETMNENLIQITATMKKKVKFTDLGICHRQGEFSSLRCQDKIQVAIDVEKMKNFFTGGVLEVRFPRKESQNVD